MERKEFKDIERFFTLFERSFDLFPEAVVLSDHVLVGALVGSPEGRRFHEDKLVGSLVVGSQLLELSLDLLGHLLAGIF